MESNPQEKKDKQATRPPRKRRNRRKTSKKQKLAKDGRDLLPSKNKVTPKSSLPPLNIKKVKEPLVNCKYCDKTIKNIASAIKGEDCYYHFDCIISKIKEDYKVKENQSVSYVGRGSFAIIEKDDSGAIKFIETIQIETPQQFDTMKKYVEEVKI